MKKSQTPEEAAKIVPSINWPSETMSNRPRIANEAPAIIFRIIGIGELGSVSRIQFILFIQPQDIQVSPVYIQ